MPAVLPPREPVSARCVPSAAARAPLLCALALLAACAHAPPSAGSVAPEPLHWMDAYTGGLAPGTRVFAIDPRASSVRIYAFRGGRAASLGHNHVLGAPRLTGYALVPAAGILSARFDVDLRLDELDLDRPEYRAGLGTAFAAPLDAEDIAGTRAHMLGDENLQAARFPELHVRSLEIAGAAPKLAARIEVQLHGQRHEYWVPLDVDGLPDHLSVAGSFVVRQSDFGVRPYAIFGGFIAVQDALVVEFRLLGSAAPAPRVD